MICSGSMQSTSSIDSRNQNLQFKPDKSPAMLRSISTTKLTVSERNLDERGQILRAFTLRQNACLPHLPDSPVNSHSIDQKNGGNCTGQVDL